MNSTQRQYLELSFLNSFHTKENCYIKREFQPFVTKFMENKEKSNFTIQTLITYLKLAQHEFITFNGINGVDFSNAATVLSNVSKRYEFNSETSTLVSFNVKDYILFVLKFIKPEQDGFNFFKRVAVKCLEDLPVPVQKDRKKAYQSHKSIINDIAIF